MSRPLRMNTSGSSFSSASGKGIDCPKRESSLNSMDPVGCDGFAMVCISCITGSVTPVERHCFPKQGMFDLGQYLCGGVRREGLTSEAPCGARWLSGRFCLVPTRSSGLPSTIVRSGRHFENRGVTHDACVTITLSRITLGTHASIRWFSLSERSKIRLAGYIVVVL